MRCHEELVKDDQDLSDVLNNFNIENPENQILFYLISNGEVKIYYERYCSEV